MKPLLLIITFLICSQINSQNDNRIGVLLINENTMALDKQQHVAAGVLISTLSYSVTMELSKEKSKPRAMIVSLGVTSLIGALKEHIDRNEGREWSQPDFFHTVSGGIFMNLIFML